MTQPMVLGPHTLGKKHCGSEMHVAEEVFHVMVTRKQRVLVFKRLHRPDLGF